MTTQTQIPAEVVDRAFEMIAEHGGSLPLPALMDLAEARTRRVVDGQQVVVIDERETYFQALVDAMVARGARWTSAPHFVDRTILVP